MQNTSNRKFYYPDKALLDKVIPKPPLGLFCVVYILLGKTFFLIWIVLEFKFEEEASVIKTIVGCRRGSYNIYVFKNEAKFERKFKAALMEMDPTHYGHC